MNKQFAIFDMDGTLIDSMGVWNHLAQEYLASLGITAISDEVMQTIAPMTLSESAAFFVRHYALECSAQQAEEQMLRMIEKHYREDIPLKAGVKEYLQEQKAQGVRMCVASATAMPLMQACLQRLEVLPLFDFLLSCEELCTSKREPLIYLEAARRFEQCPQEIAVYEDALYALQTARQAGFFTVGVYEETTAEEWEEISRTADRTIKF